MLKSIQIRIVLIFIVIVTVIISALGFAIIHIIQSNEAINLQIDQIKGLIIYSIGIFLIISIIVRNVYI